MSMKRVTITANRFNKLGAPIRIPVPASISSTITKKTLSEVKAWVPVLKRHAEEDASWDWAQILREHGSLRRARLNVYDYAILRCQRRTQALMIMEIANHRNRADKPIVYVEYLAIAPWNRPGIQHPREFVGCGSALIEHSVERSVSLGYGGLVGLHTLPGARSFYIGIGFKDLGADSQEGGLHYLQLND